MKNALEFEDWIKYAEKNDMLITKDSFLSLTEKKRYAVVEADYIRFLAIEYGKRYNIVFDKVYKAPELYAQFKEYLARLDKGKIVKAPVMKCDCKEGGKGVYAVFENVTQYEALLYHFDPEQDPFVISLSEVEDSKYLSSGSGDGYSRWMLWENVEKMPPLYITKPKDDDE
jgi:hypothetical protein